MATSGSFQTIFSTGYALVVEWAESNVNVTNNTSDITVTAILKTIKGTYHIDSTANKTVSLTIDGTTYSGTCTVGIAALSSKTLFTKTVTGIAHNATTGEKTVPISCTLGIKVNINSEYVSSVSTSGTATLTTIPRVSVPTLSASSVEMGKALTIYTNRASTSFTHKLQYAWGGTTFVDIKSDVGASHAWTVPLTLANAIPNNVSSRGTIRCITYSGSTQIGYRDIPFEATVPASAKPSCSIEVSDPTGNWAEYGLPVKGLSKFRIITSGTPSYSSPIESYSASVTYPTSGTLNYSSNDVTTDLLSEAGTIYVNASVRDSRKRTGSASTFEIDVLDYHLPTITSLSVHRCKSATDGTEDGQGEYVRVNFSAVVANINNKNTAKYQLVYTKLSTGTASSPITLNTTSYTPTNFSYIFPASTDSSYEVKIIASDNHNSISKTTSASTGFTLMHWNKSGTGIAFGKLSEKENAFELGLPVEGLLEKPEYLKPTSDTELNTMVESAFAAMPEKSRRSILVNLGYSSTALAGGLWFIDINKALASYGTVIAIQYTNNEYPRIRTRALYNNVWTGWGDLTARYVQHTGGTITGDTFINANVATAAWFRINKGWIGMYPTADDAIHATGRKGWIGFDNGSILNIRDETGGIDYISKGNQRWAVNGSNLITLVTGGFRPINNDVVYLGDSNYKWKAVYAINGTIQTSDRNAKTNIEELDQRYIDLFERLMPVSFMFNDKESDRTHIGFISQDVEAAMAEVGLTDLDFAGFCKDVKMEWDEETQENKPVLDEVGKPVYIYSLRYAEFIALNTKMIQMVRKETASLRTELEELKQLVLSMNN